MRWIRRYKHQQSGVESAGSRFGSTQWVLSRSLYRFARFDLAAVPASQRVQALRLQVGQWTPFSRVGSYVIWEGTVALVWAWNADEIEEAIKRLDLKPKSIKIIPETLLGEKRTSLSCLQQSLDGYEGQYWENGVLAASRWWPQLPSLAEWINFQRDAGLLPDMQSVEIPKPSQPKWNDQPWKRSSRLDGHTGDIATGYQTLIALSALGLVGATSWVGSQLYQYKLSVQLQQASLQELVEQNMPFVEARAASLSALAKINELQELYRQPDLLGLLAKVAEALPKDGTYIRDWDLQGNKLNYQLVSPKKLMLSDYLKKLEQIGIFKDIQTSQGNDPTVTILTMEVVAGVEVKFDPSLGFAAGSALPRAESVLEGDLTKRQVKN